MASPLVDYLEKKINASGGITVEEYMETCLHHPDWGYYRIKNPFGRDGDFITAPEISQVFGELIGALHVDLWERLDKPNPFYLIECGPGQGTLLVDFLRQAPADFVKALRLHLVEINEALRSIQETSLKAYKPAFHRSVEKALAECVDAPCFILGNEFLDALPIRQFENFADGWHERMINIKNRRFVLSHRNEVVCSKDIVFPSDAPVGAVFEYCPLAQKIIQNISHHLETHSGQALFIDYGPAKFGYGDTLQAVQAHEYQSPLQDPGKADLTAHVNFPALLKTASAYRVATYGPISQNQLLQELGIQLRGQQLLMQANPLQRLSIEKSIHRLTSPLQMGYLFKAIALAHQDCPVPAGFVKCTTPVTSVA